MLVMFPTASTLITSPVYVPDPTSPPTMPTMFAGTFSAGGQVTTHFVKVLSNVCPCTSLLNARAAPAVVATSTNAKRILHPLKDCRIFWDMSFLLVINGDELVDRIAI